MFSSNHRTPKLSKNECKRVIKRLKTWFSLYSSKYLWIIYSLFAYPQGKHLACTSLRNLVSTEQPRSSTAALPSAKCYRIFNDHWWSGLCFYHHKWSPLTTCAGLAGLMSTEHAYLNQCFDVPSSKYPILNHLGKPSHSQVLKKCPPPKYWWWASWPCDPLQLCYLWAAQGNCPGCDPIGLVPTRHLASQAMVVLRS